MKLCEALPFKPDPSAILNTGTTRAAIFWRRMIDRDPLLASQATMFWRMASVNNPNEAALNALQARKMTAQDPEGMLHKAFVYRNKRSLGPQFDFLAHDYWRKFAANDPEVTARSSMYWAANPDADMYW